MSISHDGYPLGNIFLRELQQPVFQTQEATIRNWIDKLVEFKEINQSLANLVSKLTHAKSLKDKKPAADLRDQESMQIIDSVFNINPAIFNNQKTYVWNSVDEIEATLKGLDLQLKTQMELANEATLHLNEAYSKRGKCDEAAMKILEMYIRHIESIIAKYKPQ